MYVQYCYKSHLELPSDILTIFYDNNQLYFAFIITCNKNVFMTVYSTIFRKMDVRAVANTFIVVNI